TNDGRVWESQWSNLTSVEFEGVYPNSIRIYKLNNIGLQVLKGLEINNKQQIINKITQQVVEFHETFEHPVLEKQDISDKEYQLKRLAWLREEVDELQEAIEKGLKVGVL